MRPYLRRAYSVADSNPRGGEIELLIKTIGPGTATLEVLPEGSTVRLLGPLGNSFSVGDLGSGSRVAIVAGGIGAAPFPLLLAALRAASVNCDLYLGGRNARELSIRTRFDGLVPGETILVERRRLARREGLRDGGAARGGSTPDRATPASSPAARCRCSRRSRKVVGDAGVPAEFSTEADMGCGFGACLGCVIPGTEKPFLVSCSEGPILAPEKIAWRSADERPIPLPRRCLEVRLGPLDAPESHHDGLGHLRLRARVRGLRGPVEDRRSLHEGPCR